MQSVQVQRHQNKVLYRQTAAEMTPVEPLIARNIKSINKRSTNNAGEVYTACSTISPTSGGCRIISLTYSRHAPLGPLWSRAFIAYYNLLIY